MYTASPTGKKSQLSSPQNTGPASFRSDLPPHRPTTDESRQAAMLTSGERKAEAC